MSQSSAPYVTILVLINILCAIGVSFGPSTSNSAELLADITEPEITDADIEQSMALVLRAMQPIVGSLSEPLKIVRRPVTLSGNDIFVMDVDQFNGLALNIVGSAKRAASEGITNDGFKLLLCHELGHLGGGAPFKVNRFDLPVEMSSEGQADYFATSVCLPEVFKIDDNKKFLAVLKSSKVLQEVCREETDTAALALCARSALASLSVAKHLHSLWGNGIEKVEPVPAPMLENRDASVVSFSSEKHPPAQCRLDTFLQGFACRVLGPVQSYVSNPYQKTSCGTPAGQVNRPSCWFRRAQ